MNAVKRREEEIEMLPVHPLSQLPRDRQADPEPPAESAVKKRSKIRL